MLVSTTPTLEGRRIVRYVGIVSGDAVMGANVFRDMFAGIRNIVGGRAGSYEKELQRAKQLAMESLTEQAKTLGANAVVAVDLDYESITPDGQGAMLMVSVSGTAVVVE